MMRLILLATLATAACTDVTNLGNLPPDVTMPRLSTRWATTVGPGGDVAGHAVAIDSISDVVAGGTLGNYAGVHGEALLSLHTGFISKRVASDGSERWAVQFFGETPMSFSDVSAVAVDSDDNVIVVGTYIGSVNVGGTTLSLVEPTPPDRSDELIAKFGPDGHLQWARGISTTANVLSEGVVVDAAGRIYLTGGFEGAVTLAGNSYSATDRDAFLLALDPDGDDLWAHAFQAPGDQLGLHVALATNGDVLVSGHFSGAASFGGVVLTAKSQSDIFLTRFRADGWFLASRTLGIAAPGVSWLSQTIGLHDNTIVVQTVDQPDTQTTTATIHQLDSDLDEIWNMKVPNNGLSVPYRALASSSTNVVAGQLATNADRSSAFVEVALYDDVGHRATMDVGAWISGGPGASLFRAAAASTTGGVAFIGDHTGTCDFGTGPLVGHGDAVLVMMEPQE